MNDAHDKLKSLGLNHPLEPETTHKCSTSSKTQHPFYPAAVDNIVLHGKHSQIGG
jgi:hypothetical protein